MLHDVASWYFTQSYDYPFPSEKRVVVITLLIAFTGPFLFAKQLNELRYMSTISVLTCVVLALSVIVIATGRIVDRDLAHDAHYLPAANWDVESMFAGIGAISFAYSSSVNFVNVYHELKVQTPAQGARAATLATILCMVLYLAVALTSVFGWGSAVIDAGNGNVLYLIPADNDFVTLWCFVLVVSITLLFPVILFPVLDSVRWRRHRVPLPASLADSLRARRRWRRLCCAPSRRTYRGRCSARRWWTGS